MPRVLLLIDDEPDITSLLRRMLKRSFDEVLVAYSGAEASEILRSRPVTHLVADFFLGAREPQGTALIAQWRTDYPSIRFAAVFTGRASTREIAGLPGIDAVFAKPAGFEHLLDELKTAA